MKLKEKEEASLVDVITVIGTIFVVILLVIAVDIKII